MKGIRILIGLLKIIVIISSVAFSILGLTILISSAAIKIDVPTDPSQMNFYFINDSLIINVPVKIKNYGMYNIENLVIDISVFTLDNFLITKTRVGYPYEKIEIKGGEEKTLNIHIYLNLTEITTLNIHEKILKDKAVKIHVISNGRYAFNLIYFELSVERAISSSSPFLIEFDKLTLKEIINILKIKRLEEKDNNITFYTSLKINYQGWMEMNDLEIFGEIYNNNEKLASFYSKIEKLIYGENTIETKVITNKNNLFKFLFENLNLDVNIFIKKDKFMFKKQFKYNLNKQLEIEIEDIYFEKINDEKILIKSKILLKSNIEKEIFIRSKIRIYDINNNLLDEKNIEINLVPNYNEINFESIIKGIKHGSVIKVELFIEEPIKINFPLITKILVIP